MHMHQLRQAQRQGKCSAQGRIQPASVQLACSNGGAAACPHWQVLDEMKQSMLDECMMAVGQPAIHVRQPAKA